MTPVQEGVVFAEVAERSGRRMPTRVPPLLVMSADCVALVVAGLVVSPAIAVIAFGVLTVLAGALGGDYRCRITYHVLEELPRLVVRLGFVSFVVSVAAYFLAGRDLLGALVAAMAMFVAGRVVAYAAVRFLRRRRWLVEPVVILGAGVIGRRLAANLLQRREFGLTPVGFLDQPTTARLPVPLLGDVERLPEVLAESGVSRVIVAYGLRSESELVGSLRYLPVGLVDVHIVPRFFELGMHPKGIDVDNVWGIPLSRWQSSSRRTASLVMKRALDVIVATVGLICAGPLLLALAIGVKLTSHGPAFFRQRRVGRNGRPIDVLKLRTMTQNDDSDTTWSVAADDRTTRLGRFLRRSSLDELPQLWNVLRGDMSLVGPRPERPLFVELFSSRIPGYEDRHRFPVGLTGWAQIHGLRGDSSIEDRACFDNQYIENWSLWTDLVILVRTALAVPRAAWRGERGEGSSWRDDDGSSAPGAGRPVRAGHTRAGG
jgi:exopolysaccharide biosynthesis polyprenyl glycosylphosphotransferase